MSSEKSLPSIGELPDGPISVAEFYEERLALETEQLASMAGREINWQWTGGDYSSGDLGILGPDATRPNPKPGELGLHEDFLSHVITSQLEEFPDRPIIVLDMGGGLGISWARLAQRFDDKVTAGRIVFVVSNLTPAGRISLEPRSASGEPLDNQTTEMLREVHERGLVKFVAGTAAELGEVAIELPDGQHMPLRDNVTLLHESRSLTAWSKVPERDIPKATELLAEGGVYLVRDVDTLVVQGAQSYQEEQSRINGIRLAHQALQERGLRLQTEASIGENAGSRLNWLIFTNNREGKVLV